MASILDGTKVAPHGLFFMENGGGCEAASKDLLSANDDERGSTCFAHEEEKGETWRGHGSTRHVLKESRPTL